MKKLAVGLIYLLGMVAVLAMFFPACARPGIAVESNTGFIHEASVRIPFSPGEATRLFADNEGITFLVRYIDTHRGTIHSQHEFWLEIYRIDQHGTTETKKFGPFVVVNSSIEGKNIIAFGNDDNVTYLDVASLTSKSVIDIDLADIMRNQDSVYYYDKGIVVYTESVPEKQDAERWVVIYDVTTREEVRIDLQEEFVNIHTLDISGDDIAVLGTKGIGRPAVLHVYGLDGTRKLRLDVPDRVDSVKLIRQGLIVANSDSFASVVKRYSFDGTVKWAQSLPISGLPHLKLLSSQDNDALALTLVDRNELTSFIGYFNTDDGEQVYAHTFHGDSSILPLDAAGNFYIYPQWSLYPEVPPPSGRVAFYNLDSELGVIDFSEGIYYFAASPSGKFFAVISDRSVSIFSRKE